MTVTVTENAARQITKQLQKRGKGLGLRLAVKKAGCSGFAYVVDYADDLRENDIVHETHGVKVVIKPEDMAYLDGVEVDFAREGINEAFRFNNPKAKATCGCGESFTV
jgi:iron-sulfur cluster assembly protein